jgi:alkyldihydroxyacetonephosphate synthase
VAEPAVTPKRSRSRWGWGYADAAVSDADARGIASALPSVLGGFEPDGVEQPVALEEVRLPAVRVIVPPPLADIADASPAARTAHTYGRSYLDIVRGLRGQYDHPPDVVLSPRDEEEVGRSLEWAAGANVALIPYGGGTSVVGGVEPRVPDRFDGVATLSLAALDEVLEVDSVSRAARIGAGANGPRLEAQLSEHGLTMRFYPQSFELSTLGGWVATRAAGHFATGPTHIDDVVESVDAITPSGEWRSRRLPGSGAGPSPDRMLLGSEGTLGVITQAWVRVQPRPERRAGRSVQFPDLMSGADAVRAIIQSGSRPANLRLLDPGEALGSGSGDGSHAVLVLGFESTGAPVQPELDAALALCREHGGGWADEDDSAGRRGAAGAWRDAFLRMPYLRDALIRLGVMLDTFETAITWERFPSFHEQVVAAARDAIGPSGRVTCRFTHVYSDGPAPYYTVLAPVKRGEEAEAWLKFKRAVSDALIAAGGTITHHHAVGRDHRAWYDDQRPDVFAAALKGAKAAVDPRGLLNPGVLLD